MNGLVWEERVEAPELGWARIGVGLAALAEGAYVTSLFNKATTPGVLHVPVVSWLPGPNVFLGLLLCGVWLVVAGAFTAGARTRSSGVVLAATMALTLALDRQFYSTHLYLLTLLVVLLTAANAGGYRSVDAAAGRAAETSPAWGVFLLRCQVSIVYAFAALSTVQIAYTGDDTLAASLRRAGAFVLPDAWLAPDMVGVLAVAYIGIALWLSASLWSPRRRRTAMILGMLFHAALVGLAADALAFGILGVAMVSAYAAFVVPLPTWGAEADLHPHTVH